MRNVIKMALKFLAILATKSQKLPGAQALSVIRLVALVCSARDLKYSRYQKFRATLLFFLDFGNSYKI